MASSVPVTHNGFVSASDTIVNAYLVLESIDLSVFFFFLMISSFGSWDVGLSDVVFKQTKLFYPLTSHHILTSIQSCEHACYIEAMIFSEFEKYFPFCLLHLPIYRNS